MIIKSKLKVENREKYFTYLGAAAQLALVLAISLGRIENPTLDFVTGVLIGFSIVGNIAFLIAISHKNKRS